MTVTQQRFIKHEDSGCTVMARIYGVAGTAITQASLSTIAYIISRVDTDPVTSVATGTLTIASVVYDTLQTSDPRWIDDNGIAIDTTGFNFAWFIPSGNFATGPGSYIVDLTFTPTSGSDYKFPVVFEIDTIKRYN